MELIQVLFSPAAAFASLRGKKWAWVLPTLLMLAIGVLCMFLLLNRFSAVAIMEDQIAQSGQQMPPQGVSQAAGIVTMMMYISAVVFPIISVLLIALVLLGIVKGFSGETSFPMMLNASAYSMFAAYSIVNTVLFLIMFFTAPDLRTFQLQNPIPLNAGYFVTLQDVGKAGVAFLSGINLVNFYLMYLLALGAAKLSDRVTTGKVLWPLVGIYTLYILGKTGLAAIF